MHPKGSVGKAHGHKRRGQRRRGVRLLGLVFKRTPHDRPLPSSQVGLASAVEDGAPASGWCTNPVELIGPIAALRKPGGPVDPDVAAAIRSLESSGAVRKGKDIDKVTKALGVHVVSSSPRLRDEELKKLVIASRQAFANCPSVGISVDAKRFGGKHWLAGVISCGTSGSVSITNPVVRHGGKAAAPWAEPGSFGTSEEGGGVLIVRLSELWFLPLWRLLRSSSLEQFFRAGGFLEVCLAYFLRRRFWVLKNLCFGRVRVDFLRRCSGTPTTASRSPAARSRWTRGPIGRLGRSASSRTSARMPQTNLRGNWPDAHLRAIPTVAAEAPPET